MNGESFWKRVKTLLKQNKLTQENLAEKAGLNFSNLKQQIFYNRLPDAAQATAIALSLDTTVEYLVTGKDLDHPRKARIKELLNEIDKLL